MPQNASVLTTPVIQPAASRDAPQESTRRAQIDGLRAVAMIGVLYVHFWGAHPVTEHIRVSLFFVISGFLITHILYSAKERGGRILILNF